jgi:predicted  nucleic acid-binding Zn-ribbon protein
VSVPLSSMIDQDWINVVEEKHSLLNEAINQAVAQEMKLSDEIKKLQDEIKEKTNEIDTLKSEKNPEKKIARDERDSTLEQERDYYRKESLKLNATVESMKSKLKKSEMERLKLLGCGNSFCKQLLMHVAAFA